MVWRFFGGFFLKKNKTQQSLLIYISLLAMLLALLEVCQVESKPGKYDGGPPGSEGWNWQNCCGRKCRSKHCICDSCLCTDCPSKDHIFGWPSWSLREEILEIENDWD